jgi:hypothetical protein
MGGFFKNNPVDTVVGSTDATEDTINETAVTETDSTSSFYRGSPEQTTVDGYVADAAGHAASAAQHAEDAEDHKVSASYYNSLASQQLGLAQSAANQAEGYRDSALQHRNSANISAQGASQHAHTAQGHASAASASAASILNLTVATGAAGTNASYDSSTGVLTVPRGANGLGYTGGSFDASTGVVSFTSNDGLGFSTDDLRAESNISIDAGTF